MEYRESAQLIHAAGQSFVGQLFHSVAQAYPQRVALKDDESSLTYADLDERSSRLANYFIAEGIRRGDRVAILCRNRFEYFEALLAAAKSGVILASLNWRLSEHELEHCINLVEPALIIVSEDFSGTLNTLAINSPNHLVLDENYNKALETSDVTMPLVDLNQEDGLIILYTSGTTGLPKGALVSHRAMVARGLMYHFILDVPDKDNFIAWTPLYHMVSTDHGLATLLRGGTVWCVDGYQPERLIWLLENVRISWFVLVPGMVGSFNEELKKRPVQVKGIGVIGAMADLIPRQEIAEASQLLNTPFLNTFGATETGLAPATGGHIPVGAAPETLSKIQTPFCDLRLEDSEGREVPVGTPGEASVAGPSLFSGYWNNEKANKEDFRGGRFHMGDVLRRNEDGTLDYVDRVKYMIKSGGENIYPAEIETVILADARIETAIVVRKKDQKWGEIPVVFIVKRDSGLTEGDVKEVCQTGLASYKKPREIYFIDDNDIPRSTTGKIQRHLLEDRL